MPSASATAVTTGDERLVIALLGNDGRWPQGGRTDAIILAAIDRGAPAVSLLSVPRDLYVTVPGWGRERINLVLPHGHGSGYPGGGGQLFKDTVALNLGIEVDAYARLGFDGFVRIVDTLGLLEIVVSCPVADWWLIAPELDPTLVENWEWYELPPGIRKLDGELALWYARSRRDSSDLDRGRRQQQVLEALLARAMQTENLPARLPHLWREGREAVETDLTLGQLLELSSLLPASGDLRVRHFLLAGDAVREWRTPGRGESVQLLQEAAARPVIEAFLGDSALGQAERAPIAVTVVTKDAVLYRQMADNLRWYGFAPAHETAAGPPPLETKIRYAGESLKGAFAARLSWLFGRETEDVVLDQASGPPGSYRVVLGYDANPCLDYLAGAPE